jgi:ribosome-associated heat shock protein Hsp15
MRKAERAAASSRAVAHAARVRLDKWLWAARFYKTRTLAAVAIESGQVRVDEMRIKPAHAVRVGERITIRKGALTWQIDVVACSARRGGAPEAAKLYTETPESLAAREQRTVEQRAASRLVRFPGRPTKRDRRRLEDFLNEP